MLTRRYPHKGFGVKIESKRIQQKLVRNEVTPTSLLRILQVGVNRMSVESRMI